MIFFLQQLKYIEPDLRIYMTFELFLIKFVVAASGLLEG